MADFTLYNLSKDRGAFLELFKKRFVLELISIHYTEPGPS
jgi:hypothetical protein